MQDKDIKNESPKEAAPLKKESLLFKWSPVIFAIGFASLMFYALAPNMKPLDKNYVHFENDIKENEKFDMKFSLHNLSTRKIISITERKDLIYSPTVIQQKAFNFTFNMEKESIASNPNKYAVEVAMIYNSRMLRHKKQVSCLMPLTKMLPTLVKNGEFYSNIKKDEFEGEQLHYYSKLYPSIVFDTSKYDFQEGGFEGYMYRRNPQPLTEDKKNFDYYFPFIDCSNYWLLRRDKLPVSSISEDIVNFEVEVSIPTIWRQNQVLGFHVAENQVSSILNDKKAFEEIKTIFSDNSFSYLVFMFTVNILHVLFSFLSMKNNISFYGDIKSSRGISVKKLYFDVVFEAVIILYLIENETSVLVTIMAGFQLLMAIWIALRVTKFEKTPENRFPYYQLAKSESNTEEETKKLDSEITTLLSKIFFPILLVYISYSFVTAKKLKYYTFFLHHSVTFIHTVGFIYMAPQVYINYKLQTVEFMPWKAMTYQFLNTIVDDIFAFAVKMPTLQRISVFRDDVIFVIFLYQMWAYRKSAPQKQCEEKKKE